MAQPPRAPRAAKQPGSFYQPGTYEDGTPHDNPHNFDRKAQPEIIGPTWHIKVNGVDYRLPEDVHPRYRYFFPPKPRPGQDSGTMFYSTRYPSMEAAMRDHNEGKGTCCCCGRRHNTFECRVSLSGYFTRRSFFFFLPSDLRRTPTA